MEMNLKEMTREELLALKEEIIRELKSRESQDAQKVIVDLPTFDSRHKNWIKVLSGVDRGKSDGYAFQGTFAKPGSTVELPVGTLLLYFYGSGSVKNYTVEVRVYRVTQDGLEDTGISTSRDNRKVGGWALDIRDAAADLF
jgi:hypothetical protein